MTLNFNLNPGPQPRSSPPPLTGWAFRPVHIGHLSQPPSPYTYCFGNPGPYNHGEGCLCGHDRSTNGFASLRALIADQIIFAFQVQEFFDDNYQKTIDGQDGQDGAGA